MAEVVRHETVPYYLGLRLVMGEGSRAIASKLFETGRPLEQERMQFVAGYLTPEDNAEHTRPIRTVARAALGVPVQEPNATVDALLARAAITLEELPESAPIGASDLEFADMVVSSLRYFAATQRDF